MLATLLPAVANGRAPSTLALSGKIYSKLQGERLKTAIIGYSFHAPACLDTTGCLEEFKPDGATYVRRGDRAPIIDGSYSVTDDKVCVTTFRTERCRVFFVAKDGTFAGVSTLQTEVEPVVYARGAGGKIGSYRIPAPLRGKP